MKQIAFATYSGLPGLTDSDSLVATALQEHDIAAIGTPWDDPDIEWNNFDGVVIRSTWNYHKHHQAFRDWLAELKAVNLRVWNPHEIILWNSDKIYLSQLEDAGAKIVPTEWISRCSHEEVYLEEILERNDWERAVLKPRISASAHGVSVLSIENRVENEQKFLEMRRARDLMLQPVVEEIRNGEWSIMFFDDEYSHSVLKYPEVDNIYVQKELGGTWKVADPSSQLIEQARKSIDAAHEVTGVSEPFLYTRVDGVEVKGELQLMELELIEPELFFSGVPEAVIRFAEAIAKRL